jgi:hypothetical protein
VFGPALLDHCLKQVGFVLNAKIGKDVNIEQGLFQLKLFQLKFPCKYFFYILLPNSNIYSTSRIRHFTKYGQEGFGSPTCITILLLMQI